MLNLKTCLVGTVITVHSAFTLAIDLSQAYQAALVHDATISAARAAADAGRENLPQARAQLLPNLSASFSRNNNRLTSRTPNFLGQISESNFSYPSSNNSLMLRQPIYRRYQWAQYQQAKAQIDDVNAVLESELQNLSTRVAGAYFDALLALDQLTLTQTQLATYRTHLDAAQKMLKAGTGTRTDIDEAQARLDMSLAQELEARQNVDYTRQQLQVLVGQPIDALARLDAEGLPLLAPSPAHVEAWIDLAEQSSAELRALRARAEVAAREVDKASAGHQPTLDAVAQWTRSSSENQTSVTSSYESRSIGLQLTVPLFSGGGVSSAVRQALANKERAEQILEAGRRDLGVRVHKEFRGVSEGVLRVQALEQAAKSAERAVLSSQRSFQAGVRTRIDVLNAENSRLVALRDLAQARYAYLLSQLRLKSLVDAANADSVEAINKLLQH